MPAKHLPTQAELEDALTRAIEWTNAIPHGVAYDEYRIGRILVTKKELITLGLKHKSKPGVIVQSWWMSGLPKELRY